MSDYLYKQFGNYRLVKLLGEGAFAQVYLGEHVQLGSQAAIKILIAKLTNEAIAQFREEARIIVSLEHPNIVRVLDFDLQGNIPFIVTSYAPGGSLGQLHPSGSRLALSTVITYVKQIASALQYAHERKLIHRDVKPDNMLIGRNNEVLLSDFGIAVIAHSTRSLSTEQFISGTFYYMAPEQIQGKPRIASDQYALGIVVYEWLIGKPPFMGTATEIGMQHLLIPPPSLHEKVPSIPVEVERVVFKALAKDPQDRYPSVQAFSNALEQTTIQAAKVVPKPVPPKQPIKPPQPRAVRPNPAIMQPTPVIQQKPLSPTNTSRPTKDWLRIFFVILSIGLLLSGTVAITKLHNTPVQPTPTSVAASTVATSTLKSVTPKILYEENGSDNWKGWKESADWQLDSPWLINDGNGDPVHWIRAPYQPGSINDYTVEADIAVDSGCGTFGIIFRAEPNEQLLNYLNFAQNSDTEGK